MPPRHRENAAMATKKALHDLGQARTDLAADLLQCRAVVGDVDVELPAARGGCGPNLR